MKNSNETIGNRTRELPTCRAVRLNQLRHRVPHCFPGLPQISYSTSTTDVALPTLYTPPYLHPYYHHCLYYLQHIYYLSKFTCKINVIHYRYVSELFISSLSVKHTTQRFERKLPSSSPENFSPENESNLF